MGRAADRETGQRPASEIFQVLPSGYETAVVDNALRDRGNASESTRNQLSGSIRKLRVKGFRDANRAKPELLAGAVLDAIEGGNEALAAAVLMTWMETRSRLREAAAAHLRQRGIEVIDPPGIAFTRSWETSECLLERDRLLEDHEADADDATLMLCLLTGRFPGPPPLESELFGAWIERLWDLPATAPEWTAEAISLTKWIRFIRAEKLAEVMRITIAEIFQRKARIESGFKDELLYLGIEAVTLGAAPATPEGTAAALTFLAALETRLAEYRPLRPQASSRGEEIERAGARQAAEEDILALARNWESTLALAEEAWEADAGDEDEENDQHAGADDDRQASTPADGADGEGPQGESSSLREENHRLRRRNEALEARSAEHDGEIGALNDEIARARRTEEQWRRAYVESRKGQRPGDEPVRIDSVRHAVALAREAFPDRLLIKLNSRSDEDTPFARPGEVYDVLAWLATTYRDASGTRIGEACSGWSLKTNQVEESIAKYREWYETTADGKTWFLGAHLGKGTSRDPRHTIRIGFARDDENERVIVGFIGLHQRNRQS